MALPPKPRRTPGRRPINALVREMQRNEKKKAINGTTYIKVTPEFLEKMYNDGLHPLVARDKKVLEIMGLSEGIWVQKGTEGRR